MEDHKTIRLLFVEDNEFDFELAVHELKSSGLEFICRCVETLDDFNSEIRTFNPDIIISDYFLSDFDALAILDIVLTDFPEIPVIITTGTINEETAVICMKAGATDYVLKDQIRRLPFSVKEAMLKSSILKQKVYAEAALRQSETRFSSLLNNISNIAVQGYAPDGTVLYWNKASERLYQYSEEEALGKTLYDLIIPTRMVELVKRNVSKMLETGLSHAGEELELKRKDGSPVHVFSNHAIHKSNDKMELFCIDIDLTERLVAERALFESEKRYRNLVENSLIGIYQCSTEGHFKFVNEALVRLLDYSSPDELISRQVEEVFLYPDDISELMMSISISKSTSDFETVLLTKYREQKDVILSAALDDNNISGLILDITGRKISEREILKAKEKAEESDKLKSSFLANLSHEVRTPMNVIVGYAELLLDKGLNEETRDSFVETISQNTYQLLKIITDIIEISKIETEQLTIHYKEFSLNEMMNDLWSVYHKIAEKKSISLDFINVCNGEQMLVISDDSKIRQTLSHLLDNAIKFTEKGGIKVYCEKVGLSLEFSIEDTGIGVKPGFEKLIFEPFRQVEDTLRRRYGGNGLGLSIAKAYIESVGGSIWLKPNPGGGSVFEFSIPVRFRRSESSAGWSELTENPDYSHLTFLIAEDENTNYKYLERLLMPTGASLLHADSGKQAIEIIENNSNIHLVFMDIKMPEIDGLEATRIVKQQKPYLPVIATTAYVMTGDKEMCLAAGCDGYVAKPIRRAELFRIIRKVIY